MNKYIRILNKIICIIALLFMLSNFYSVKAAGKKESATSGTSIKTLQEKADAFLEKGEGNVGSIDMDDAFGEIASIGSILTTIGAGVMVAVVTYMGIKYLTAGPEAQAKLKVQLIGVVVSGMVIFGSYFIWKTVVGVANTF